AFIAAQKAMKVSTGMTKDQFVSKYILGTAGLADPEEALEEANFLADSIYGTEPEAPVEPGPVGAPYTPPPIEGITEAQWQEIVNSPVALEEARAAWGAGAVAPFEAKYSTSKRGTIQR
ncbi:unnamed protein product, partial [marine sediment metagenome]